MKKSKSDRETPAQQKLPSALSCQDGCFNVMSNYFLHCGSCPLFETIRSDPLMQMIHAVTGEKEIRTLTMPHLKIFVNDERNTFAKCSQK